MCILSFTDISETFQELVEDRLVLWSWQASQVAHLQVPESIVVNYEIRSRSAKLEQTLRNKAPFAHPSDPAGLDFRLNLLQNESITKYEI